MSSQDTSVLPDGARRLLIGAIDSFEKLELVIAPAQIGQSFAQARRPLETRTSATVQALEQALSELAAAGIVVEDVDCPLGARQRSR